MSQISQIAKGFFNNLLNKEEDLYESRIRICRECPIRTVDRVFGEICDPSLYINEKNEVSKQSKPGFKKGCGCILSSKTRVDEAKCIINKW